MKKRSRIGGGESPGLKRSEQRELAKAGMVASLGTLAVTGLFRFKGSWMLHTWAGVFLVGFSLWHHFLNRPHKTPAPAKTAAAARKGT
jgi:hypothetical protein